MGNLAGRWGNSSNPRGEEFVGEKMRKRVDRSRAGRMKAPGARTGVD